MKLDQKKHVNRLVIYFFYDADGVVDRYVPYMLEDVKKNCSELFVVCNGKLTPEGRETFQQFTPNIMVRENVGFDVWAYKEALEHYDWDKLAEYDEVVLMNFTIMGPLYPFAEMFEEMNKRDLDFWGITKFHKVMSNPYDNIYGYLPEHIQSHFIAVRQSMLKSVEFQRYWKTRPKIKSYADAVGKHESIFTKLFNDAGFKWGCYVDTTALEELTHYPLMITPLKIIEEYKCPIFKRRTFFQPILDLISYSDANQGLQLLEYLQKNTKYDVSMVWENIIRSCNMADIKNALSLNYILPSEYILCKPKPQKLALVMHIYFEDLIEYCYNYALSMPAEADIYITSDKEEKCKEIEKKFKQGPWYNVKVILIENRGRDVSSLLVGFKPYAEQYDLVCFMHDKKVTQLDYGSKGQAFSDRCFENMLGSKEYVSNIIDLFDKNPFLGLLCPPPPNHADFYITIGCEWGPNFKITKQLSEKLELNCSIKEEKEPVAPLGTMFWFRTKAMKKLFDYDWDYDDFPKEPNKIDGTLLHAIERIYPFVVQDAGFYSALVLTEKNARTEWSHLLYMLRELNIRVFAAYGLNNLNSLMETINYYIYHPELDGPVPNLRFLLKQKIKAKTPKPVWALLKKIYHIFGGKKWVG